MFIESFLCSYKYEFNDCNHNFHKHLSNIKNDSYMTSVKDI